MPEITIKDIQDLKSLMEKADAPPWEADIDDPNTERAMWTRKFYVDDWKDTWCTYGAGETEQKHVANAKLVAAAITWLPEFIEFWEKKR